MNYKKIYNQLIEKAKDRVIDGYQERHHIVPRCLGGSDDKDNIVGLTPEEHFVAHVLLVKVYPNNDGMIVAVQMMTRGHCGRRNRKLYGWLRRKFSEVQSRRMSGAGNTQFGTKWKWIHSGDKIRKIKLTEATPEGWHSGIKPKKPKKPKLNAVDVNLMNMYHDIYIKVGWDEFKLLTGYNKSKQNLVQHFVKCVPCFVPQNGKKRGLLVEGSIT